MVVKEATIEITSKVKRVTKVGSSSRKHHVHLHQQMGPAKSTVDTHGSSASTTHEAPATEEVAMAQVLETVEVMEVSNASAMLEAIAMGETVEEMDSTILTSLLKQVQSRDNNQCKKRMREPRGT
jgi:hypothetical protein